MCGDYFRQAEKDISLNISAPNGILPKSLVLKGGNVTDVNLRLASRNNMNCSKLKKEKKSFKKKEKRNNTLRSAKLA